MEVALRTVNSRYVVVLACLIVGSVAAQAPPEKEFPQIADLLALKPGSIVADVGAGSGSWSILLAEKVGPTGRVFATDVRPEFVSQIRQATAAFPNITVVLGTQDSTELPPECCDAILLRLVYHAFRNPRAMRESLARAVRPGGQVLVIDFPGGVWAGPTPPVLEAQMAEVGLTKAGLHDPWQGERNVFAVLFRKPPRK